MRYIKTYESFRETKLKDQDPVNEEFLEKLKGIFKAIFGKAGGILDKFKGSVEELLAKTADVFNPKDANSVLKSEYDKFAKNPSVNDQACFDFISGVFDPDDGSLSDANLKNLFDSMEDEENKEIVKKGIEIGRKQIIKFIGYGGGKTDAWVIGKPLPKPAIPIEMKTGLKVQRDPKNPAEFADKTHLPALKNLIKGLEDGNKKRDAVLKWFEGTVMPKFDEFVSKAEVGGEGEGAEEGEYKAGDTVIYKRDKFNEEEWKKIKDEDKKKPNEGPMKDLQDKEMIGIKKVKEIKGEDVSFEDAEFTKKTSDLLGKVEGGEKAEGQDDLVKTLGDVKSKNPSAIPKLKDIADLYLDPDGNKNKIAEISNIVNTDK